MANAVGFAVRSVAPARRKGSYGVDAPYLLPIPVVLIATNILQGVLSGTTWPFVAAWMLVACVSCGLHASLRGKFAVWSELLDGLALRGDERVLDLGCGRGAVLLMAAQRLTTGRAVGVDIWSKGDQSGNAAEATRRNAVAEGVVDRVQLLTAEMTALPFEDRRFDLVLSSIAVHNVKGRAGRDRAIGEAVARAAPRRPADDRRHLRDRPVPRLPRGTRHDRRRVPRAGVAVVVERPLAANPPRHRHQAVG